MLVKTKTHCHDVTCLLVSQRRKCDRGIRRARILLYKEYKIGLSISGGSLASYGNRVDDYVHERSRKDVNLYQRVTARAINTRSSRTATSSGNRLVWSIESTAGDYGRRCYRQPEAAFIKPNPLPVTTPVFLSPSCESEKLWKSRLIRTIERCGGWRERMRQRRRM